MLNAAKSWWAEPAVASPPPRTRRDWAIAALVVAGTISEVAFRSDLVWRPVAFVLGCVIAGALLIRSRHPLRASAVAYGTIASLDIATWLAGDRAVTLVSSFVVLLLVYSLLRWASGRDVVVGMGFVITAFAAAVTVDYSGSSDAVGGAAVLLFVAALGAAVRYRHAARDQLVTQAKLHERGQLARELHDTVAHHVTAIAIQAQAGRYLARFESSSGARDALETIEREAASALAEMRTIVGALRDHQELSMLAPRPRLVDIGAMATTGVDSLLVHVDLGDAPIDLAPAVEAALYRIAQESITNVRRHAPGATRVMVTVKADATEVHMTIRNNGSRTSPTSQRSGYGIVGMTERAALLGGALTAAPKSNGDWCVQVALPRRVTP